MDRKIILVIIGMLCFSILKGQGESSFQLKIDLFGLAASIPNSQYLKLSPEIEWKLKQSESWSFTLDFEHYTFKRPYLNYALSAIGGEIYYGNAIRKENSVRLGARRYFGNQSAANSGGYVEIQGGISNEENDSIYLVVAQRTYFSQRLHSEFRIRSGYQYSFSKHLFMDATIEIDVRRIITREDWFRCLGPELNFGVRL